MKKYISLLLVLLLAMALSAPALADIAYEPNDNFYEKHRDDCDYENRRYYANGAEGFVTVYASPGGRGRDAVANGAAFWVSWTYDKGSWGYVEYGDDVRGSGWVKLSDTVCDYDSVAFRADHTDELVQSERLFRPDRTAGNAVYAYTYPGSGAVRAKMDWESVWEEEISFSALFTDPAGRTWGYCGYHYGHRELWICLDDPYNAALAADENYVDPLANTAPAADTATLASAVRAARLPKPYLIAGAAGAVLIAAVLLALVLRRKKTA